MPTYQIKKQGKKLIFSKLEEDKDTIELIFPLVRPSEVSALLDGDEKPSGLLLVGAINRLLQYPYKVANAEMPTNWLQNDEQSIDIQNTYSEFRLRDFDGAFTQLEELRKFLVPFIQKAVGSFSKNYQVPVRKNGVKSQQDLLASPFVSQYQFLSSISALIAKGEHKEEFKNKIVKGKTGLSTDEINEAFISEQQPDLMAALNELPAPSSLVRAAVSYISFFSIAPSRLKTVVDRLRADLEKLNVLEHQPEVKV